MPEIVAAANCLSASNLFRVQRKVKSMQPTPVFSASEQKDGSNTLTLATDHSSKNLSRLLFFPFSDARAQRLLKNFYTRVFGGQITRRNGLNVTHRKRGAVPHTFIRIGGKRIGVYLQSEHRPAPKGLRGSPIYSFITTTQGLEQTIKELKQFGTEFEGPVKNAHSFAAQIDIFS